mmetsp:Transcript_44853/g.122704  ORF Transcript_44853/g.122704 Transcript_44853/m.122704 type:complete len:315 (+) Transcript_44853:363-1307(+)
MTGGACSWNCGWGRKRRALPSAACPRRLRRRSCQTHAYLRCVMMTCILGLFGSGIDKKRSQGSENAFQAPVCRGEVLLTQSSLVRLSFLLTRNMKFAAVVTLAVALLAGSATAYTSSSFAGSRAALASGRAAAGRSALRMEDFGFLKGSGIGFDDLWEGQAVISERALENELNAQGLRYKMNKTAKEAEVCGPLGFDIEIGPIKLNAPRVDSIWEAMGFAATSNNEARQKVKLEAQAKAAADPTGARAKYLGKYGYPRLVGTKGIFYADQLSTDKEPMGGFGMYKSGVMWPVPEVVESGCYGGKRGWGGKAGKK